MSTFRHAIIATIAAPFFTLGCDADFGSSRRIDLEAAALSSEAEWDVQVSIDAGAVERAPTLEIAVPVSLRDARSRLVEGEALLALYDAESGEELSSTQLSFFRGAPVVDRLEVSIDDPCADKARCVRAFRVGLHVNAGGVVASPEFEATIGAGDLALVSE